MTGRGWVWSLLLLQYVGYVQTARVHIKGNGTGIKETAAAWIIDQSCVSAVAQNLEKVHNLGKNMLAEAWNGSVTVSFVVSGVGNPSQKSFFFSVTFESMSRSAFF